MDRRKKDELPKMQVGFIDFVCMPLYKMLSDLIPDLDPLLEGVKGNRKNWHILAQDPKGTLTSCYYRNPKALVVSSLTSKGVEIIKWEVAPWSIYLIPCLVTLSLYPGTLFMCTQLLLQIQTIKRHHQVMDLLTTSLPSLPMSPLPLPSSAPHKTLQTRMGPLKAGPIPTTAAAVRRVVATVSHTIENQGPSQLTLKWPVRDGTSKGVL